MISSTLRALFFSALFGLVTGNISAQTAKITCEFEAPDSMVMLKLDDFSQSLGTGPGGAAQVGTWEPT